MMRARAWFLPSIRWRRNLHDRHRGHARSVTCAAYRPPSPQVEPPTPNDFAGALGSRPHPADGGMGHRPSWRSSFVSDHGNPQLGDAPAGTAGPFKADELGPSRFKADIEAFDLAEPAVELRLDDAVGEASDDLDQASPLCGVYAEHRASDTCFSEQ